MLKQLSAFDKAAVHALNGLVKKSPLFDGLAKLLAMLPVYFIPVALVALWFRSPSSRLAEVRAVVAGLLAWQVINRILQTIFERSRPIELARVPELLFKRPIDSFPSNHAALGMAIAVTLLLANERGAGWVVFVLTLVFSLFRVVVGLHFPSDILVGWLVGAVAAAGAHLAAGLIDHWLGQPLLNFAKWVKLG